MKKVLFVKIIIVLLLALIFCYIYYKNTSMDSVLKNFVKEEEKGNSKLGQPYVGTLYIPDLKLRHGFVSNETDEETCMDSEVCAFNFSEQKPEFKNSKVIIGNSMDGGLKGNFVGLKTLKPGALAYVEKDDVVFKYKLYYVEKQTNSLDDMAYGPKNKRQLLLIGTSQTTNYYVLHFNYIADYKIK